MRKYARLGTKTQIDLIYYRTEGQTLQAQQQTQMLNGLLRFGILTEKKQKTENLFLLNWLQNLI